MPWLPTMPGPPTRRRHARASPTAISR